MASIPRRNLLALVVLSLLAEEPMHPYKMRVEMQARAKEFLGINLGSMYHAIERLQQQGLIEVVGTDREGRRPERTVYQATGAGRAELRPWVRELLLDVGSDLPPAVGALAQIGVMSAEECHPLICERVRLLQEQIDGYDRGMTVALEHEVPRRYLLEVEYGRAIKAAERDWLLSLADEIARGEMRWGSLLGEGGPGMD
ncbi:MAG TPA: helix-turn-helix transcriptional regulator [Candidatus Dormibacteraeota bacterium]|jgi:DNA-binding PadR family transcriptional regulator|nr:helix-turn-helix transcriptional regulator [Candidatus Dormibacteraeota bacterium]